MPPDWIDRATGRARTMFIGQDLANSYAFWSLEFWNQSIQDVWSVDASRTGRRGRRVTPNFLDTDGALDPQLPLDWIVAPPGVDPVGRIVEQAGGLTLYRVAAPDPHRELRLRDRIADGWMPTSAGTYRFAPKRRARERQSITLTRTAACGDRRRPLSPSGSNLRIDSRRPAGGGSALQRVRQERVAPRRAS